MLQVLAVTSTDGFAQEVTVSQHAAVKLPSGVDIHQAAGLPVAFGTAYLALVERARLQKGQTVVVLGAGGGVGTAAVQAGAEKLPLARKWPQRRLHFGLR